MIHGIVKYNITKKLLLPVQDSENHIQTICQNKPDTAKESCKTERCQQKDDGESDHFMVVAINLFFTHECKHETFRYSIYCNDEDVYTIPS